MILVALGTQDKSFLRLIEAVQKQIDNGVINEKVIVQSGCTKFQSNDMEFIKLMPPDKFKELIVRARFIICHAGVGILVDSLKHNKKVIAVARRVKYKEHVNDHQVQILREFEQKGYILALRDIDQLDKYIKDINMFKPKKFIEDGRKIREIITEYIDGI